jgi:hypothetical protein
MEIHQSQTADTDFTMHWIDPRQTDASSSYFSWVTMNSLGSAGCVLCKINDRCHDERIARPTHASFFPEPSCVKAVTKQQPVKHKHKNSNSPHCYTRLPGKSQEVFGSLLPTRSPSVSCSLSALSLAHPSLWQYCLELAFT